LRRGDILNLKWDQIRNGFVYPDKVAATKKRREIPINEDLAEVLKEIRKEQGLTSKYVFTYCKRNISRVDRAFKAVLKRAGIDNLRFHDEAYICEPFDYEGSHAEESSRAFGP
jgi:integrase